jgi:hypothetical protein
MPTFDSTPTLSATHPSEHEAALPVPVEGVDPSRPLPFHANAIVTKCKVQLMLMDAVHDFILHFFPNDAADYGGEPTHTKGAAAAAVTPYTLLSNTMNVTL